jgi:hypothetical protein
MPAAKHVLMPLPQYLQPRRDDLRRLHIIREASNKHGAAYVDAATMDKWGVRMAPVAQEPLEFSAAAPFFKPMPLAKLAGPYKQRWEELRDEFGRWPQFGPEWQGSSIIPHATLHWFLRLLGVGPYATDDGLRSLSEWEWQGFAYNRLSFPFPSAGYTNGTYRSYLITSMPASLCYAGALLSPSPNCLTPSLLSVPVYFTEVMLATTGKLPGQLSFC